MKGFFICPACKGNGYRRIIKDNDHKLKQEEEERLKKEEEQILLAQKKSEEKIKSEEVAKSENNKSLWGMITGLMKGKKD